MSGFEEFVEVFCDSGKACQAYSILKAQKEKACCEEYSNFCDVRKNMIYLMFRHTSMYNRFWTDYGVIGIQENKFIINIKK